MNREIKIRWAIRLWQSNIKTNFLKWPQEILDWKDWVDRQPNKGTDCIKLGNAAVNKAVEMGTSQTLYMLNARDEINTVREENVQLHDVLSRQPMNDAEQGNEVKLLQEEIDRLKKKLQEQDANKEACKHRQEEIDDLKRKLREQDANKEACKHRQEEIDDLKRKLQEHDATKEESDQQRKDLIDELERLKADFVTERVGRRLAGLNMKRVGIARKDEQNITMMERDAMQQKHHQEKDQLAKTIEQLNEQLKSSEKKLEDLRKPLLNKLNHEGCKEELQKRDRRIRELNGQLEKLRRDYTEAQKVRQSLEKRKNSTEQGPPEIGKLRDEVDSLQRRIASMDEQAKKDAVELNRFRKEEVLSGKVTLVEQTGADDGYFPHNIDWMDMDELRHLATKHKERISWLSGAWQEDHNDFVGQVRGLKRRNKKIVVGIKELSKQNKNYADRIQIHQNEKGHLRKEIGDWRILANTRGRIIEKWAHSTQGELKAEHQHFQKLTHKSIRRNWKFFGLPNII